MSAMACPEHDQLCDFAAHVLPAAQAAQVELHIADCDDCRQLLFALAEDVPAPAQRIGRFEILDVIGEGAMGTVYRARDPDLDRLVAIKVRRSRARLDADREERLRREARALARLTHPNVVSVYETGTHDGLAFVAMELVDGDTLDAWLRTRRSRSEIIALLADAARGLAAAHAVGLVHRDVKPHNVLVSSRGIAKIGDFGLVRVDRRVDVAGTASDPDPTLTLSSGALIGTPAYMAPEQLRGEVATEASDQFGFCVTLFEALYGRRPFNGATTRELVGEIERGVVFPTLPQVPARIRRVLERGLAGDPRRRFSSMTALADALAKRPARLGWIAGAGTLALGATALVLVKSGAAVAPCSGAEAHVREVWSAERKTAIERAFAATQLPYASDASKHVEAALDDYTATWALAHRRSCEAGRRAEQSPQLLDARMQCLAHRLDDVRALTDVLVAADAAVVRRAAHAVEELPSIDRCFDLDAVMARVRPPDDPATRAAVEQLRRELAPARADYALGRFDKTVAHLGPLVDRARTIAYPPVLAEILFELGRAKSSLDDASGAAAALDESARVAYASRDDETAAHAWVELVYVIGEQRADPKTAATSAQMARAALTRVPQPVWQIQLLSHEAVLLHAAGDYAAARDKYREALALASKVLPPDHDSFATLRNNLANTLAQLGDTDQALQLLREAVAIRERSAGPQHPDTATNRANLGRMLDTLGRHAEALVELDRAIAALEASLGPNHPALATALSNSCTTLDALGRHADALDRARRALAIFEARLGATHPVTAQATAQVGAMLVGLHRPREAIPLFERALATQEERLGKEHPNLATLLDNLGDALLEAGDAKAAIPYFERARTILEASVGRDHRRLVYPLAGLGQATLERGDAAKAIELLRRAMAIQEKTAAVPEERGHVRFVLAKAMWKAGDRKGAVAMARQALGDVAAEEHGDVEAWLHGR